MRHCHSITSRRDPAVGAPAVRCALATLLFVAACGLAGNVTATAHAAEGAAPADGKAGESLFSTNCVACHAEGGNIIDPSKPVRGSARLKDFETFLAWIRAPKSPMTAFPPDQIPDAQVRELYRYVVEVLAKPAAK